MCIAINTWLSTGVSVDNLQLLTKCDTLILLKGYKNKNYVN